MKKQVVADGKAKGISKGFGRLGTALTVASGVGIANSYYNGEISTGRFIFEEVGNGLAAAPYPYGAGWGLGWETGRLITETEVYLDFKYYYMFSLRREYLGY